MGGGLAHIRIDRPHPEHKPERLVATVLANSEDFFEIRTMHQTETLNMWGFGLEIVAMLTDGDRKALPDQIPVSSFSVGVS